VHACPWRAPLHDATCCCCACCVLAGPTPYHHADPRVQAYLLPSNVAVSCGQVLRAQGLRGVYVGFGVTLMRDVPEIAIQFTVYDALLRALQQTPPPPQQHSREKELWERRQHWRKVSQHPLLLGAVAGAVAAVVTTPLDVIKTQLQVRGCARSTVRLCCLGTPRSRFFVSATPANPCSALLRVHARAHTPKHTQSHTHIHTHADRSWGSQSVRMKACRSSQLFAGGPIICSCALPNQCLLPVLLLLHTRACSAMVCQGRGRPSRAC